MLRKCTKRFSSLRQFEPYFTNKKPVEWSSQLRNSICEHKESISAYRLLDQNGQILNFDEYPEELKDNSLLVKMYKAMVNVSVMDKILYESQRQGRISFYLTSFGEEATQIASAAALDAQDLVYAQYREVGVLLWRGFGLSAIMDQCYSTCDDIGKGKQMPVHYGSKKCNFVTISSPLATQVIQAVGAAYVYRIQNLSKVVIVYFGEGAASEGDVHAAMNFAVTLKTPVIFFCRNNGYAISTPATEQYGSDGIIVRALAYGMQGVRVDGNDLFAVYNACKFARDYCLRNNTPFLIEALTYRIGHHSTSDDSSVYRGNDEVEHWKRNFNPITRVKLFLESKQYWNEKDEDDLQKTVKADILKAFNLAEQKLKPNWSEMFTDVYFHLTDHLKLQKQELHDHLSKYKEKYPLDNYKKID